MLEEKVLALLVALLDPMDQRRLILVLEQVAVRVPSVSVVILYVQFLLVLLLLVLLKVPLDAKSPLGALRLFPIEK